MYTCQIGNAGAQARCFCEITVGMVASRSLCRLGRRIWCDPSGRRHVHLRVSKMKRFPLALDSRVFHAGIVAREFISLDGTPTPRLGSDGRSALTDCPNPSHESGREKHSVRSQIVKHGPSDIGKLNLDDRTRGCSAQLTSALVPPLSSTALRSTATSSARPFCECITSDRENDILVWESTGPAENPTR